MSWMKRARYKVRVGVSLAVYQATLTRRIGEIWMQGTLDPPSALAPLQPSMWRGLAIDKKKMELSFRNDELRRAEQPSE